MPINKRNKSKTKWEIVLSKQTMQFWIIQYLWGCEIEVSTWETNFEQLREIKIVYIPISSNIFPEKYFTEGNSCTDTLKYVCVHCRQHSCL